MRHYFREGGVETQKLLFRLVLLLPIANQITAMEYFKQYLSPTKYPGKRLL